MLKLSTATCCLMLPPPTSDEEPLDPALTAEPHLSPWEGSSALVTEAREAVCRGCRTSDSRIYKYQQGEGQLGAMRSPHPDFVVGGWTASWWGRGTGSSSCWWSSIWDYLTWRGRSMSCWEDWNSRYNCYWDYRRLNVDILWGIRI